MEEQNNLSIDEELTMLVIQLQERQEQLISTIRALEAEIQRLNQIAQY